ncbi:hypothetical protein M1367_00040 [Candidatus Marsarchaeota archaeon]|jgi:hypothetical protein|nr:hypothetical protein [Candidatus Marsarchaeota archaeon]
MANHKRSKKSAKNTPKKDSAKAIGVLGLFLGMVVAFFVFFSVAMISALAYLMLVVVVMIIYIVYTENHGLIHTFTDGFLMGVLGILVALFIRGVLFKFKSAHRKLYTSLITIPIVIIAIFVIAFLLYSNTLFQLNTPEILYSNHYFYKNFTISGHGSLNCTFTSTLPVVVYIMTPSEYIQWTNGYSTPFYYTLNDSYYANVNVPLGSGQWYLLVDNPSQYDANITFSECSYS